MSFLQIWGRIAGETELIKLVQLADFVGVSQQFVSKKKKEGSFPVEWAFLIARKYDLSTDWIMTGEGPKRLEDTKPTKLYKDPVLNYLDEWLDELVVNQPYRREWFRASIEDAFPMFSEWKKRKEAEKGEDYNTPTNNVA